MEHGASNHDHVDKDEVVHHMEDENVQAAEASCYEMYNSSSHKVDSPTQPFVQEDVAATTYYALVAYQNTYFEMTQARFQHLDYQIEGVREQLGELYYKHK